MDLEQQTLRTAIYDYDYYDLDNHEVYYYSSFIIQIIYLLLMQLPLLLHKVLANLRMKLLFSPSVAVSTVISIVTLRWVSPLISMLHTRTRSRPAQQQRVKLK